MNRISLLSPQLTNQIAAGEVIERPASVVKELLENSLDAKAERIEIDIEKGGTQLIRVRDDGVGIHRDDLVLALSRHATSKISVLDDLEKVTSLGFRGEALASISSVSRLTLSSCFMGESAGWQVRGEGRDEILDLMPLAHPRGTTVEVRDLFFNTPARRKFLRSEQTEFNHLLEVVKRIALSRFDIGVILRHNQRIVHQLRPALDEAMQLRRVADLCATSFIENALSVTAEVQGLRLSGWIALPTALRKQADLQYFYVNGRMVRDKLVNHAVRQAYQQWLSPDQHPAFVLYLELDPRAVDVNAHPTKSEVRFHESRWVHDFLFKVLDDALLSVREAPVRDNKIPSHSAHSDSPLSHVGEIMGSAQSDSPLSHVGEIMSSAQSDSPLPLWERSTREARRVRGSIQTTPFSAYEALHTVPPHVEEKTSIHYAVETKKEFPLGTALSQLHTRYALAENSKGLVVIDLFLLQRILLKDALQKNFAASNERLSSQPLLMPLSITLDEKEAMCVEQARDRLQQFGFDITRSSPHTIMVRKIPQLLYAANIQHVVRQFIAQLSHKMLDNNALLNNLAEFAVVLIDRAFSVAEINTMLRQLESISVATTSCCTQWSISHLLTTHES